MDTNFKRILVAYEDTLGGNKALDLGIALNKINKESTLIVAHVFQEQVKNVPTPEAEKVIDTVRTNGYLLEGIQVPPLSVENTEHSNHVKVENSLDEVLFKLKETLKAENVQALYNTLEGNPAESLCDFAAAQDADILIVGKSNKSGIKEMFLGSISEKIANEAPCHVLIAK
ncbi:universal stress protein [Cytobacillus sp. FJAT-54145]|uniref:Universal stress protein n=1 Tax=Cytobacillus spartinae TaxID=3299023 RepID=A0ABW6KB69_9BACI